MSIQRLLYWVGSQTDQFRSLNTDNLLSQLEERQFGNADTVRTYQWQQIQLIVRHARENCPWYREKLRDVSIDNFKDWNDWSKIPILSRQELIEHVDDLIDENGRQLSYISTSGSTGKPVTVVRDPQTRRVVRAISRRAYRWYGVDRSSPSFWLVGTPSSRLQLFKYWVNDRLHARYRQTCFDMSEPALDKILQRIKAFKPHVLNGYASAIFGMCQHARRMRFDLSSVGIKLIVPQSEVLYEFQEKEMREVIGAPVMNEYGCVEVGAMAHVCPQGTFHINHDHVMIEIIDDNGCPVKIGQPGRIVLTPLHAFAMPLIRYALGDRGTLINKTCSCGIFPGLPVFKYVEGRDWDKVYSTDGQRFHTVLVYYAAKQAFPSRSVLEYQGIQEALNQIRFFVVKGPSFKVDDINKFENILREKLGISMRFTFEYVENIPRSNSGKMFYFICKINP